MKLAGNIDHNMLTSIWDEGHLEGHGHLLGHITL